MGKYVPAIVTGLIVTIVVAFLLGLIGFRGFAAWYVPLFVGIFTGYIMANLQGTKAGPVATEAEKAAALSLRPSPGKALILIHRQGFVGKAAGMEVTLDDRVLGQLKSPQFTAVEVDPGAHTLGFGFVGLAAAQNKREIVPVTVMAGQAVAYRATISMGMGKNTIKIDRDDEVSMLADDLRRVKMVAPAVA
ncbi:hypothetical protein [Brevundimonas sp.]|uniref:hypothetical protein n=1 Tax=Brevundimonas sp. TaxID=1871086 RepID=UPI003F71C508